MVLRAACSEVREKSRCRVIMVLVISPQQLQSHCTVCPHLAARLAAMMSASTIHTLHANMTRSSIVFPSYINDLTSCNHSSVPRKELTQTLGVAISGLHAAQQTAKQVLPTNCNATKIPREDNKSDVQLA